MKTIILSAALMASSLFSVAGPANLESEIKQNIKIPAFASSQTFTEVVYVSFTILADGHVEVLEMNVSDQEFGAYVK